MRAALALLLASLTFAACGSDDLQQFRDTADDAVQGIQNADPDQLRERLKDVQDDLKSSDVPEDARRELEDARDQLERALR